MTQKTILITGANRGIGLALVKNYINKKEKVIATCRTPKDAEELKKLQKDYKDLSIETLDITKNKDRKSLSEKLDRTPIDILINNAGIYSGNGIHINSNTPDPSQEFGTIDPNAWIKVLRTNSIAPVMLTQELFKNLENGNDKKIIMISSEWGSIELMDDKDAIAYRTSKTILNTATKAIAVHLQLKNYIVIAINPGWTRTRMGGLDNATYSTTESAEKMSVVFEKLSNKQNGAFLGLNGETLPW